MSENTQYDIEEQEAAKKLQRDGVRVGIEYTAKADEPMAIDAKSFLSQVKPVLGSENAWADMENHKNKTVALQLANGQTWTPSGRDSRIVFHPKGSVWYEGGISPEQAQEREVDGAMKYGDNPQIGLKHTADQDFYEVTGDASKLLNKEGSGARITVKYVQQGDKMVPMQAPDIRAYDKNAAETRLSAASMFAAAMTLGSSMAATAAGTAATTGAAATGGWSLGGAATSIATNAAKSAMLQGALTGRIDAGTAIKGAVLGEAAGAISGSVGGWAKEAGASNFVAKAAGNMAGAGSVAAATGRDVGTALVDSGISSVVGNYIKDPIKKYTGSGFISDIAGSTANAYIHGQTPNFPGIIQGALTDQFVKFSNPYVKQVEDGIVAGVKGAMPTYGWSNDGNKP